MKKDLFIKALKFVLQWEGGFVDNPHDHGGATNKGITQNTYNSWRKSKKLCLQSVKYISDQEVQDIYYRNYWLCAKCDKMTAQFAILAFDTAVNMGVSRVTEFMKAAAWKYPDRFIAARAAKYKEFAQYGNQKLFLNGWLNRLDALKKFIKTI